MTLCSQRHTGKSENLLKLACPWCWQLLCNQMPGQTGYIHSVFEDQDLGRVFKTQVTELVHEGALSYITNSWQLGEQLNKGDQSTESVRIINLIKYKGSQVSKVVKGDQLTWGSWCQSGQVMIASLTKFPCLLQGVPKQCKHIQVLHEDLVDHQEASLVQRQNPVFSQSTLCLHNNPPKK